MARSARQPARRAGADDEPPIREPVYGVLGLDAELRLAQTAARDDKLAVRETFADEPAEIESRAT